MSDQEKDPFEKFDKLFDEADKKSVVQPSTRKKEPSFEDINTPNGQKGSLNGRNVKAARIILTVFFVVLAVQIFPLFIMRNNLTFLPFFSIIFIFAIINILIKAFKR